MINKFLKDTASLSYNDWFKACFNKQGIIAHVALDIVNVRQSTNWHPELTVGWHTYLVIQALIESGADELLAAGFFHDHGKASSSLVHRTGKITSYGHADKSAKFFKECVGKQPDLFADVDVDKTAWIIQRHMDFDPGHVRFKSPEKYTDEGDYTALETFVIADKLRSRELFYERFSEYELLNLEKEIKYTSSQLNMCAISPSRLFVKIGMSGSGKSSCKVYNDSLKADNYFPVVSTDIIRKEMLGYVGFDPDIEPLVWAHAYDKISGYLDNAKSVIFDATNVTKYTRVKTLTEIQSRTDRPFRRIGLLYPVIDPQTARDRIQTQLDAGIDRSDVPIEVIQKQHKNLKESIKAQFTDLHELKYISCR